mmetsp:Transcript_39075/g.88009  ORF Transcript_39075/g.88009 Transcript_39075/m.88009 type:complete len:261 (-) Transcript_39075:112-894(-)
MFHTTFPAVSALGFPSLAHLLQAGLAPSASRYAFFLSLGMVSMAEVFDKTWFCALVFAMRHERKTVFWACFAGLVIHVFIAAAFGYSVSRLLTPRTLDFLAASIYGAFALLYGYDWLTSEKNSDIIEEGKKEAAASWCEEECPVNEEEGNYGSIKPAKKAIGQSTGRVFWQCFVAVFIAEWGDRTQIAMIGIHASQPLVPVMLGSTVAFGIVTLLAVFLGSVLVNKTLKESTIRAACAASFVLFTVVALRDGLRETRTSF